jgi:hypothetical protein
MYLVFAGYDYYPSGGWNDFQDKFQTLDPVITYLNAYCLKYDWAEVVDLKTYRVAQRYNKVDHEWLET